MTNGTDIAAEIAAALIEGATATGSGEYFATLEKPGSKTGPAYNPTIGDPTYHRLTVLEDWQQQGDQSGTVVGQALHKLMVAATGPVPEKDDRIALGVLPQNASGGSEWHEIIDVMPTAPGGEALMYEVTLDR